MMNETWLLIDNNVLGRMTREQRASTFVHERCRIPADVLREAAGLPDIGELRELEYPVTARVLEHLARVMATVEPNDFALVDLYKNKGTADPVLVASALDAQEKADATLFGDVWKIVSDDAAVREKAGQFGFAVLSTKQLVALI